MKHTIVSASPDKNRFFLVLKDDKGKQSSMVFDLEIVDGRLAAVIRINEKPIWFSDKIQNIRLKDSPEEARSPND